jgi:hypothetical protein
MDTLAPLPVMAPPGARKTARMPSVISIPRRGSIMTTPTGGLTLDPTAFQSLVALALLTKRKATLVRRGTRLRMTQVTAAIAFVTATDVLCRYQRAMGPRFGTLDLPPGGWVQFTYTKDLYGDGSHEGGGFNNWWTDQYMPTSRELQATIAGDFSTDRQNEMDPACVVPFFTLFPEDRHGIACMEYIRCIHISAFRRYELARAQEGAVQSAGG